MSLDKISRFMGRVPVDNRPITRAELNKVLLRLEDEMATITFANQISQAAEDALNTFQTGLNTAEHRVAQMWNVMNVVVGVLSEKELVTDDSLRDMGEKLMNQAREHFAKIKQASSASKILGANGKPAAVAPPKSPVFPLEHTIDLIEKR